MKQLVQPLFVLVLGLGLVACEAQEPEQQAAIEEPSAVDTGAIRAGVEDAAQQWAAAANAGDAEALTNLYADDATIYAPDTPPISGRDAIHEFFTQMVSEGPYPITLTTNDVIIPESGEIAIERGAFEDASGSGKYVAIYRNIDGSWKLIADTWNNNGPGAANPE
ncbi:MAG TPA: SgcJ/EcaC family oxidoreductase [Gemmatimonadota bacterium]|nr:SgcJ/EcaC family oxidoreductase [Gemmatimonadota bacterium]